jgi:hypothetical protein
MRGKKPEPQRTQRKSRGSSSFLKMFLCVFCLSSVSSVVQAEIIDRVVAVVSGQVITQSDVNAAIAFGMAGDLQALIDRTLMLSEVRRVAPPDPPPAAVQARLEHMRSRFATPAAFARELAASGLEESALAVFAADDVRLAAYVDERFSAASQPTDAEIRQAGEAERERLATERRQTLVGAWIMELRRRAEITLLPG